MPKRHIQSLSQVSYEDSDVLPYDTSAGIAHFFPNTTKIQVPEKKKKTKKEKKPRCYPRLNSKFLLQSGTTFTLCYTCPFHHLRVCHASPLPKKLSLPMPCTHQTQFTCYFLAVTFTSNPERIYYLLWDFVTISTLISFLSFYQFSFPCDGAYSGRDTSERTEVMGQPFQGSFKSSFGGLSWWFSG